MISSDITGIILAGGKSSRLGFDKGFAEISGRTLVEIAIGHLQPLASEILISTNNEDYRQFGYETVPDIIPEIGPMGGIFSAIKKSRNPLCFVLSVDMPFIGKSVIEYILSRSADFQVTVPWMGGRHYEPLCGVYHGAVRPVMEQFIQAGNYKLPDLFEKVTIRKLEFSSELSFFHPELFRNVNSPADLDAAKKLAHLIEF